MPWLPHCQERTSVPIERDDRWAPEMVWALWGVDKFLAPASSLVATLKVSWLPRSKVFNPLSAELNPICHLLALLGAHPILHISRIRVNRISYCTGIVNSSCVNIVLLIFFFNCGTLWKLAAILTFQKFLLSPS